MIGDLRYAPARPPFFCPLQRMLPPLKKGGWISVRRAAALQAGRHRRIHGPTGRKMAESCDLVDAAVRSALAGPRGCTS